MVIWGFFGGMCEDEFYIMNEWIFGFYSMLVVEVEIEVVEVVEWEGWIWLCDEGWEGWEIQCEEVFIQLMLYGIKDFIENMLIIFIWVFIDWMKFLGE